MLALKPTPDKNYAVIDGLTLPYTLEEIDAICDAAALEPGGKVADDAFYEDLIARVFEIPTSLAKRSEAIQSNYAL